MPLMMPEPTIDDDFRRRTVAPHNDPASTAFDGSMQSGAGPWEAHGASMYNSRPPSPVVSAPPMQSAPPPQFDAAPRYDTPQPTMPDAVPPEAQERVRSAFSQAMADRRAAGEMVTGPQDIPFDQHAAADIFERYLGVANPQPVEPTGIERALALLEQPPTAPPSRRVSSGSGISGGTRSSGERDGTRSPMYNRARDHAERSVSRRTSDTDDTEPNSNARRKRRRRFSSQ